ncbi:MAG: transposase [Phycisphaerae bacterium]|nr:MAG: transposase [Phycisphaerae bacterium]
MPDYQRLFAPGATFFFTVVTNFRKPILSSRPAQECLRSAFRHVQLRYPFEIDACVILPDHLHCIWTLPKDETNFSMRWSAIKATFTRQFVAGGGSETARSESRRKRGERGIWQRRFWEHIVRNETEFGVYVDYIHYNPVKHGLARCPHEWGPSSFHRWVRDGEYLKDWMCLCDGGLKSPPKFGAVERFVGE